MVGVAATAIGFGFFGGRLGLAPVWSVMFTASAGAAVAQGSSVSAPGATAGVSARSVVATDSRAAFAPACGFFPKISAVVAAAISLAEITSPSGPAFSISDPVALAFAGPLTRAADTLKSRTVGTGT